MQLFARSFKYHRPRGVMAAGAEEPNALVLLEPGPFAEPNLRATEIELYDGLAAESVNRWPTLRFDLGAATGLASGLFVAGFYYKTFMWPPSWWNRIYAPAIRRMAGLARAPGEPDPEVYEHRHAHCDVLVVGGGPAGHRGGSCGRRFRRARDAGGRAPAVRRFAAGRGRARRGRGRPGMGRADAGRRIGAAAAPHHGLRLLRS